jgi:2-polyprenyl-3-methyl-5-hydroxy-6-metoxy-1,4-benzoquinol methylase
MKSTCILCGNQKIRILYPEKQQKRPVTFPHRSHRYYKITQSSGVRKNILQCEECSLIFQEVNLDRSDILEWYVLGQDDQYLREFKNRVGNAKRILSLLSQDGTGKRLLDVGCSTGILLYAAKEMGYDIYGIEPSKWAVEYIDARLGFKNIFCGSLEDYPIRENYFDVITLLDVIEHFSNPRRNLEIIHRLLKPDGKIVILTPDIGSLMARTFKSRWWCIIPEHLFYFSRKTLRLLLEQTGFTVEKQMSIGRTFNLSHWAYKVVGERYKPWIENSILSKIPLHINLGDQMLVVGSKGGIYA